ncbi:hypothetical protein SAMN04489812_2376 [Microlunatus soli]|uniref:Dolichyl-phosphate-mannose-protein mannosyltransferase n=1 Tax=Microlunatus soli TaxID=630515 RepID=A0A1H1TFL9_9ACTN|nr:hypothetical protein SAMN04489812_2376 [Microlunatus soli]
MLVFHLATRLVIIVALLIAAAISERTFPEVVLRWDGQWFERVATEGYPADLPIGLDGKVESNTTAFFPVFPLLVKGLMTLGMPFWLGSMIINLAASSAAVLLIVLVGSQYLDRHAAQLLGCVWTTFPLSSVLTTAYSEAVFGVVAAASLLFMLRRNWVLAGVAAALAGATRPTGIVFAGAVGLAALIAIAQRREWRSAIGAAIAPLGFLGTVLGTGLYAGRWDAWAVTERDGWHLKLNFGAGWLKWLDLSASTPVGYVHLVTATIVVVLLILTIIAIALRPPVPIIALMVVGAFVACAYDGVGMNAAPRNMMSMFPIFAPVAILLARCPAGVRWTVLGIGAVVSAVVGAAVFAFVPLPP